MAVGSAKQTISGYVDTLNKSNNSFQLLLKEMAAIDVCEDQEELTPISFLVVFHRMLKTLIGHLTLVV